MFENLSEKIERAFKTLKGQGAISEINVSETVKEIRKALLDADVNFKIAKDFTNQVKEKALGQKVLTSVSPGQLLVKITQDELTELMGSQQADIHLKGNPAVVLLAGLQGSGKTTFCGKLAKHLLSKKKKPFLIACDVYRPAAIDQLKTLAEQLEVDSWTDYENKDVVSIAKKGIDEAKKVGADVVIVDTAGRLSIDQEMMSEISTLKNSVNPCETLFVVDAMIGQDAVRTAKAFNDVLDLTGVILSKMDGDARGGAALSIKAELNKPIKFIGTGEKLEALEVFHPDRIASRILGKGDVVSFVEKVQQEYDEKKEQELREKVKKSKIDFNDFMNQLNQLKKMGGFKDVLGMLPGGNKVLKGQNLDFMNQKVKNIESIIGSMTPSERANPHLLADMNRKNRIAKGSGHTLQDVNKLIKEFEQMKKMMKKISNGKMPQLPF